MHHRLDWHSLVVLFFDLIPIFTEKSYNKAQTGTSVLTVSLSFSQ